MDQHKGFANAMLRQVCLQHPHISCGQCYKACFEANWYFEVSSLAKTKMIGRYDDTSKLINACRVYFCLKTTIVGIFVHVHLPETNLMYILFLNMGQSRPILVYFHPFKWQFKFKLNKEKHRGCAWDSTPGPQYGRRRRVFVILGIWAFCLTMFR